MKPYSLKVIFFVVVLMLSGDLYAKYYDFSDNSTGQLLYYITSHQFRPGIPGVGSGNAWATCPDISKWDYDRTKPTGVLMLPDSAKNGSQKYRVTGINRYAFENCNQITNINLPNTITIIDSLAFAGMNQPWIKVGLNYQYFTRKISIPASVNQIVGNPFRGSHIDTLIVDVNNSKFDSRNNCNAIIETASNKLITGSRNSVIPNNIAIIGEYAFRSIKLVNNPITIPASVRKIEKHAFEYTFYVDNSPNRVGTGTEIPLVFEAGIQLETIEEYVFANCSYNITLPEGVKYIKRWAFSGSDLNHISLPSTLINMEVYSFYDCPHIKAITCHAQQPPSISTFDICTNPDVRELFHGGVYPSQIILYVPHNKVTRYRNDGEWGQFGHIRPICDTIGTCGSNLTWNFSWDETDMGTFTISGNGNMNNYMNINSLPWEILCSYIKSVSIGNQVKSLGNYAFASCIELTSISIPQSVNSIGLSTFQNCTKLTNLSISNNVSTIGDSAFFGCNALQSFTFPSNLSSIGESAFQGCSNLSFKTLPSTLTGIGKSAFANCSSLRSVIIPNNITTIEDETFANCENLRQLILPQGIMSSQRYKTFSFPLNFSYL